MEYLRNENEVPPQPYHNGSDIDSLGLQHTGGWRSEYQPVESLDLDDSVMDVTPVGTFEVNPQIVLSEQPSQRANGPFVGLNIGEELVRHAPELRVVDPAGVSRDLDFRCWNVYDGYLPGGSEPQFQADGLNTGWLVAQRGPASEDIRSAAVTEESAYIDDVSSIASGLEDEESTKATSTSPSQPDKHICNECGNSYVRPSDLRKHKRKHIPEHERPIECLICGKKWLHKKDLIRHEYNHSEPQFQCGKCSRWFKRPDHLARHSKKGCGATRTRASTTLQGPATLSPQAQRRRAVSAPSQARPREWLPNPMTPMDTHFEHDAQGMMTIQFDSPRIQDPELYRHDHDMSDIDEATFGTSTATLGIWLL